MLGISEFLNVKLLVFGDEVGKAELVVMENGGRCYFRELNRIR